METEVKVHMYDTDMAGVIFYAKQFYYIHEAIEDIFEKLNIPFVDLFTKSPYIFVIVHAESDYIAPLNVRDKLRIKTEVGKVGVHSITLNFSLFRGEDLVGRAETVQVCLDAKSRKKKSLSKEFVEKISSLLS